MSGTAGTITAPSTLGVTAGLLTALPGLGFASVFYFPVYTVTFTASSGTLLLGPAPVGVDPAAISGEGTGTLTLSGSAAAIASELPSLAYVAAGPGAATLTISSSDTPEGDVSAPKTIAITAAAAPAAQTFTWQGTPNAAWNVAADWSVGGTTAARAPGLGDAVVLAGALVGNIGAAGSLAVNASDTLTGDVEIAGAASIAGRISVLGTSDLSPAILLTGSTTLTAAAAEVDIALGKWVNAGRFAVGSGSVFLRGFSTLDTGSLSVASGGELVVDPSATLAVTGALALSGLFVGLGAISAGSVSFAAGSDTILQGAVASAAVTVAASALVDGAGTVGSTGGSIVNNGTIEGAVALSPLDLAGNVTGNGVLLIDPGGGLELDGAVSAGQTVEIAAGVTPLFVDGNGAAGGVLALTDPGAFAGTIEGFAPGDRLVIVPSTGVTIASAVLVGTTLQLRNGSGTIVNSLQVDPTALPAGTSFLVAANATQDVFSALTFAANAVEIVAVPPAPQVATSGGIRLQAGLQEPIPLVSSYDPAGYAAHDTFTLTMTATNGTLTELLSLPLFLSHLVNDFSNTASLGALFNPRAVGDGTYDFNGSGIGGTGTTPEPLTVSGSGTGTLTVTSNNLLLLDLQSALLDYQAAGNSGADSITVRFSDGTNTTVTTVPVAIQSGGRAQFAWTSTNTASALSAANWTSPTHPGPLPGAGDAITLGTGAYTITGDFSGDSLDVTGRALTQGAIFVGDSSGGAAPLTVEGGGIFGSAGFLFVNGNAVVGANGAGELDTVGLINNIAGNLTIGASAAGYVQNGGLLVVNGAVLVGAGASGTLDISSAPVSSAGIGFPGLLSDNSATIGVSAGQTGLAIVDGTSWYNDLDLIIGGAGRGTLEVASAANSSIATVSARNVVLGQSVGSFGFAVLGAQQELDTTGDLHVGVGGQASLIAEDYSQLRLGQSQATTGPEFTGTLDIGGSATGPGLVSLEGGQVDADTINVGAGGAGSLLINGTGAFVSLNSTLGTTGSTLGTLSISASGTVDLEQGVIRAAHALVNGRLIIAAAAGFSIGTAEVSGGVALKGGALAAQLRIDAGGIVAGTGAVGNSYTQTLDNAGTVEALGGMLTVNSRITASSGHGLLEIGSGGTLGLLASSLTNPGTSAIDGTQAIAFVGQGVLALSDFISGASVAMRHRNTVTPGVTGFSTGDAIDLPTGTQLALVGAVANQVTLDFFDSGSNGYAELALTFAGGNYSAANFHVQSDGANGQELAYVACFATGTRIRTASGDVAVEALVVGDTVVLADGGTRPIAWIGRRAIECRRHPRPHDVRPVRIAADAFGPGLPARPLRLSPDHALFVNDVLIPAAHLVNGTNVTQPECDRVVYWHVELDAHDILMAEGLPTESYLDTGNRHAFANARVLAMAHPRFGRDAGGCARLVLAGPELKAVHALLAARPAERVAA